MEFSRQEHWSGLSFPPPRDLPDSGIEPASLEFLALAGGFFTGSATWEALKRTDHYQIVSSSILSVICIGNNNKKGKLREEARSSNI